VSCSVPGVGGPNQIPIGLFPMTLAPAVSFADAREIGNAVLSLPFRIAIQAHVSIAQRTGTVFDEKLQSLHLVASNADMFRYHSEAKPRFFVLWLEKLSAGDTRAAHRAPEGPTPWGGWGG
jgi:hypothetical protein